MSYTNPMKIANGLALDFTVDAANTSVDSFLGHDASGSVVSFSSIPGSRVSGANLTESSSSVLTITGGSGSVLSAVSIQVKQASGSQAGYLSSADWTTFNNKLGTALTTGKIWLGVASVASQVTPSGAWTMNSTGVTTLGAGVVANANVAAGAAIAVNKLAAMSASLVTATDGSGFLTTVAGFTTTIAGYLTNITSDVQAQFTSVKQTIVNLTTSATVRAPGAGQNGYAIIWNNGTSSWDLGPVGGGGSVTGPGTSTNTALVRWNGTGGTSIQNSGVLLDGSNNMTGVASILASNSGLRSIDGSGSFYMAIAVGSNYTAARTLTLTTGDANRTITLNGNPTLNDWFNQNVKTTGTPSFSSVTVGNTGLKALDTGGSFNLTYKPGSLLTANRTLTFTTGDADRTLTINASGTVYVTGGTDVSLADGGTGASLVDPGANTLMGWDDTDNAVSFWTLGSGLSYDHSTHTLSATGGSSAWLLASGGTLTGANTITGTTTNTIKYVFNSLGTTPVNGAGLWLANTTAAAAGVQQISPSIVWEGQGWKTNAVAASQSVRFKEDVLPVQGLSSPAATWRLQYSINGGVYNNMATADSNGSWTFYTNGSSGTVTLSDSQLVFSSSMAMSSGGDVLVTSGSSTSISTFNASFTNSGPIAIFTGSGTSGNAGSGDVSIYTGTKSGTGKRGNISLHSSAGSFGTGELVTFIANAVTNPSTNPTGGGILYADAGALKWRGSSGTVTTIAPA